MALLLQISPIHAAMEATHLVESNKVSPNSSLEAQTSQGVKYTAMGLFGKWQAITHQPEI